MYKLCDSGVYSREIINMFFVGQVSGLVENIDIGIYSGTVKVINVKLCMMALLTELFCYTTFRPYVTAVSNSFN